MTNLSFFNFAGFLMCCMVLMGANNCSPKSLETESASPSESSQDALTVEKVIEEIKENLTCEWGGGPIDTIKTGSMAHEVTGIATTFMATLSVIKKANSKGLNMIITHEPTFYNHFDNMDPLKDDPVQNAKLKYIEDNGITIWRFHDYWHKTDPDGINQGIIDRLAWGDYLRGDGKGLHLHPDMMFDLPETDLSELASDIAKKFNTSTLRVVGNPSMKIQTAGIVPGAWGSYKQIEMLNQEGIDVLIVGESREWETVEYVRDANELGKDIALIVMGHADSEDPGMEYCAKWLKGFIAEVPVEFIAAGNPLWTPDPGE